MTTPVTLTTMKALVESRSEVGSSRKSTMGSWMMSVSMEIRQRSPLETLRWPSSPMTKGGRSSEEREGWSETNEGRSLKEREKRFGVNNFIVS